MWRDAALVAGKDLRIEARSRVATSQILPFAVLVLVLFAFALDPDSGLLAQAAPGLFWLAVLFTTVLAVTRAHAVESASGVADGLRSTRLDPAGVFLGKVAALAVQLVVVELILGAGLVVLYGTTLSGWTTLVPAALAATVGLAAAGSLYGALATGSRAREGLLALLLLPVVAPVLVAATRAFEGALGTATLAVDAADWVALLVVFAVVWTGLGVLTYGPLTEDG